MGKDQDMLKDNRFALTGADGMTWRPEKAPEDLRAPYEERQRYGHRAGRRDGPPLPADDVVSHVRAVRDMGPGSVEPLKRERPPIGGRPAGIGLGAKLSGDTLPPAGGQDRWSDGASSRTPSVRRLGGLCIMPSALARGRRRLRQAFRRSLGASALACARTCQQRGSTSNQRATSGSVGRPVVVSWWYPSFPGYHRPSLSA